VLLRALGPRLRAPRNTTHVSSGPDRSPWRALRRPAMRWWSGANLVSSAGTWMQLTVQNLLVLQVTGSPAAAGLSLAVQAGPGLLLGVAGGSVVDRWPRKAVVTVSQLLLGMIAIATAALVALDVLSLALLLCLSAVTGIVATIDGPATSLLGNDLVPADDVPSAIALGSMIHSVGRLAGVGLAGGAVTLAGPATAYVVNGLSFLAVAVLVPFLRLHRDSAQVDVPAGSAEEVPARLETPAARGAGGLEGVRFFAGRPRLVALLVVTAVSAVFGRNYTLTLTVLVTGALAGSAQDFSTVATVLAVGGILGAFLAGRLRRPSVRLVALLAAAGAGLQVVAGLAPSLLVLVVVVAPMAVVESISDTAGATVLQTDPPAEMRGRVLGVWRSASTAWNLAGPPLLGLLMELIGVRGALVLGGLAVVATIALGSARHRLVRRRRRDLVESHALAA
jgi:MFS family permease